MNYLSILHERKGNWVSAFPYLKDFKMSLEYLWILGRYLLKR